MLNIKLRLSSYICLEISLNIKLYLKKFFQKNLRGLACFPIFKVKKFCILKIALRKKKAPAKADAYFLSLK